MVRNLTKHRMQSNRRLFVLGGLKLMLASTLFARLYYLQILKRDDFKTLSNGNRIRILPKLPLRGDMTDRHGKLMARSIARYQLYFERGALAKDEATHVAQRIAQLLNHPEPHKLQEQIETLYADYSTTPILLQDYLNWNEVAMLQVHSHELSGTRIIVPHIREYPYAELTTHLLGYIAPLSAKELAHYPNNRLYHNPEYKIGKTGLEKTLEHTLQGKPGAEHMEVNARGHYVRMLKKDDGKPGKNIHLSIDMPLQARVTQRLKKQGGVQEEAASAAVIDCRNGDILALTSVPHYDGNMLITGISNTDWQALLNHYDKPLQYKAVSNPYPPGSTFKIVTAAAALEAGIVDAQSSIHCPGHFDSGDRLFHCWKRSGHGKLPLHQAMAQSCNVFFYTLASKVGIEAIAKMARHLGLGDDYNLPLDTIRSGTIPTKAWKEATYGKPWYLGDTLNSAIGQGFVASTPLQLAVMSARIASGRAITPRLVLPENNPPIHASPLSLKPQTLALIQKGMAWVVNSEIGTARGSRNLEEKYSFAGKTGTSQTTNKLYGGEIPKTRKDRHHALFAGYAPLNAPKYALCVAIEHGGSGGAAAKIAQKIVKDAVDIIG